MTTDGPNSSRRRKRTQPQAEQPSSPATTPNVTPAVKRRRLYGITNSSPSTPKGFSAITSAIGGTPRSGRRGSAKNVPATAQAKSADESVYDVPGSSSADEAAEKLWDLPIKHKKLGIKPPNKSQHSVKPVYDVPVSGDESDELHKTNTAQKDLQSTPPKSKTTNGVSTTSTRKSIGERLLASRKKKRPEPIQEEVEPEQSTPRRRGRPPKTLGEVDAASPAAKPATARLLSRAVDASPGSEAPKLKGILTPQKSKVGRPPKNVAFDEEDDGKETEVFFEDIGSKTRSPKATKGSTKKPSEEEPAPEGEESEAEDSEDDEVCAICSKGDSEPPNEIIFCENCDMAVHQRCYNVPVIPEGDWICRNCSQEDVLSGAKPTPNKQLSIPKSTDVPSIPNFERHLLNMQRVLLDRCSGIRRIKLRGQSEAYEKAFQLVEQTISAGEGNSMMVIGARGCGKTTMVEEVILNLRAEHEEDFHVVRLNGFIHTDDKLALKEIWRQLGKEMNLEDDLVNRTNNYADTMASLLALLSHPAEITGADEGVTSKSVVFVIDEFDLFATHARQTLLYNLFDIAQARKAPIAVLGLTTRIDVVESLEKRVKSRFSHRYVYMSLPKTLPAYWDICKQGLSIDEGELGREGFDLNLKGLHQFQEYWNNKIETLRKTPKFEAHFEYHFYATKSVPAFLTSCILPLSTLSPASPDLEIPACSSGVVSLEPVESKLHLLAALSDLELALIISAARLDIVAHTDTVNFAMAYDEYSSQMGKQRLQSATSGMLALGGGARIWGRAVAAVAWERMVSLGLLIPAGIGGRSNAAHGGLEGKMWKLDVALDEIPAAVELPGFLAKWCSHI
ncbi:origin recognition complex subunit 4 C-terminus-domain-containing protein [Xylariaceae sp. FL0662B]|nr:origin recognition complex subunit 4 C-terminus-domain-containing protein [Xylariaceae sp. FL0662B]